jgi:RNA polymerase sigma factor for flagellar operon FliA
VKFETFAAPRIRGAIYDGLRQLDWVPRSVRSRAREVEKAIAELEHSLGRAPTDDELAARLHIGETELARWLASIAATTIGPLDRAVAAGYEPESVESAGLEHPVNVLEDRELRGVMHDEIKRLPEREKLVLSLYYDEGLTLAEIGEVLGVTESRVSQIHTKSVLHLRSRLTAAGVS